MKKNSISVSILGPTNSGKSTLLNAINKKKISIVSHKVQTTNFNIESSINYRNTKLTFVDTPGYYSKKKNLDLENKTNEAIIFSEVLLVVLDITSNISPAKIIPNPTKPRCLQVLYQSGIANSIPPACSPFHAAQGQPMIFHTKKLDNCAMAQYNKTVVLKNKTNL